MHYKNGREAHNGDKVLLVPSYGPPVVGILYDAVSGNDFCNGRIAPISPSDPCPNLKEVLHFDDVVVALSLGEQLGLVTPTEDGWAGAGNVDPQDRRSAEAQRQS